MSTREDIIDIDESIRALKEVNDVGLILWDDLDRELDSMPQEEPHFGQVWRCKENGALVMVTRIDVVADLNQPLRCSIRASGRVWEFDGPIERFYRGYERTDLKSLD